jgi:mannan endo-1,4-beta-mannosidase
VTAARARRRDGAARAESRVNRIALAASCLVAVVFTRSAGGNDFSAETPRQVLDRIVNSSRTLFGVHDNVGGDQANGFETIRRLCGVRPTILSLDFGFSTHPNEDFRRRPALLEKARNAARQGVWITLSWHQCNPTLDEPCTFNQGVQKRLGEDEWNSLLTDGAALNQKWKRQVDRLAAYLKSLQKMGVAVLLRPYHEANIPGFWWAHPDARYSKALWRQQRTYFEERHGLTNIIWVWSVSFHPSHWERVGEYYPGDDVVDVVGLDIYPPTRDGAPDFARAWNALQRIAPAKPLALTEVSRLPSEAELKARRWAYVVAWGKTMLSRDNTARQICDAFAGR